MKIPILLFTLLLSTPLFAQQEFNERINTKKVNNTYGFCLMGKTMQCNGVTASYIASEQAKMSFAFGLVYDREYQLGSTPLGILTGLRLEYCRPYAQFEENGLHYKIEAHDLAGAIPIMLLYHDKLGSQTELQLFTGPNLDMILFRKGTASAGSMVGSGTFLFGSPLENGLKPAWHWMGLSWNFGIGIRHNDIILKLSSAYGLLNHFDKDYTAQYIGYPVYIHRPVIGTVMFKL